MKDVYPLISIIIPTQNRSAILCRTLEKLCCQTYPAKKMEVIVVADGCRDDTAERVTEFWAPFILRIVEQRASGQSVARNLGSSLANGEILLFLDDDILADPYLVEAHCAVHANRQDQVGIGYVPLMHNRQPGFFQVELRGWWEDMFEPMLRPGYRYKYSDLLSGNMSISAGFFRQVGGFDPHIHCHEDYELGLRLLNAGAQFIFCPSALGWHISHIDIKGALKRKYEEGIADVYLGTLYPELNPILAFSLLEQNALWPSRVLKILAFHWSALGDWLVGIFRWSLTALEFFKMRVLWLRILMGLLGYWYWRGIADQFNSRQATKDLIGLSEKPQKKRQKGLQGGIDDLGLKYDDYFCTQDCDLDVDLCEGIETAMASVDRQRPYSLGIMFGSELIGCIPAKPGAEKLRGVHLQAVIMGRYAKYWFDRFEIESRA
jgi:glycosyltransferase involved in cell wall biosynthesis